VHVGAESETTDTPHTMIRDHQAVNLFNNAPLQVMATSCDSGTPHQPTKSDAKADGKGDLYVRIRWGGLI